MRRYLAILGLTTISTLICNCSFHTSVAEARSQLPADIVLDAGVAPAPGDFQDASLAGRELGWVRARSIKFAGSADANSDAATGPEFPREAPSGSQRRPRILLIHGSPGGWNGYLDYMRQPALLERADLIAVDRPGYGASNAGQALSNLKAQAAMLGPLLEHLAASGPVLVVGHSYGGPVAVRLAIDFPEAVAGLVLVAASVDPELEEWRWFNRVADWTPVQWLLPAAWNVSNAEIKPLRDDLLEMQSAWAGIRQPVAIVHGGEDSLVPIGNADFARRMLVASADIAEHIYPDENHFILWERLDLLVPILIECLDWPARLQ